MSTEIESLQLTIQSNSTSATNGINKLTESLNKLKKATSGGLGLSSVAKDIGKVASASNNAAKSTANASTSFTDLYHRLKLAASGFKAVGKAIYSAIQKSTSYTETMNLFTVSMGEYAYEAAQYAESVSELMGIDPAEWMKFQGTIMTLATGFGIAGDRASVMSEQLTQLAYDISSFREISIEDAMLKIQSGFAGELEPLRAIGYDLSQARLEAIALELGIDKAVSSMTQAEKAQLRYYAIMTQVTMAQRDMAKTLESPANQLRVFKAQLNMAAREIGNIFIPALNAILPYAIAVTKIIRILASNIASLFGYEMPDISEATDKATENTNSMKENLEEGQKEAKKLKSYLLGFDELNIINPNSDETDDLSSGFDFELPKYDFLDESVKSKVATIVDEMKEWLGITEDITSWSDLFDTRLGKIFIAVGAIGVSLAAWRIAEGVAGTITMLSNLSKIGSFTLGLALVVTGITIGALAIESALTEGLNGVNASSLLVASASIIAGGALIGKTFGSGLIGAAIGAIIAGVAGLGIGLYDAISKELNVTNGLTIALSTGMIGAGIGALIGGPLGAAMGAIAGVITGSAIDASIWLFQNSDDTVTKIMGIVSAVPLALGAILAFSGVNIPLGIALMAIGAVSLASAIAMNTTALSDEVKEVIAIITSTVSVALLAVGAVLAFTGANIPLGIALMAGGALIMATAILPNWNTLSDSVKETISIIMAAVGGALLVLGAVLAFSGVNIPLGIGLMVAGAISLGTSMALNWNAISDALQGPIGAITALVSGALLALGIILLLTGVGIPLGIGLIIAGAAGLGTVVAVNWNFLTNKVREIWDGIVAICSTIAGWYDENVRQPIFDIFRELWKSVSGFFSNLWDDIVGIWKAVSTWFNENVIQPLVNFFEGAVLRIGQFFEGCWLIIQAVWLIVSTWFDENVIQPLANFFKGLWETVSGFFSELWVGIKQTWMYVSDWFNKVVVKPVVNFFKGVWESVSGFFSDLWVDIKKVWMKVSDWFNEVIIEPVKTAFSKACTAISGFFSNLWLGIRQGIANAMNAVIGTIESAINWVIGGINGLIGGFDKIVRWAADVLGKDWGGMTLVKEVKFSRITVPTYAEGGFPEQGQMFIAREAGAEMVGNIGRRTAVANNEQIVASISGGVAEANEEQNALLREQNSLLRAILEKDSGVYLDGKNLTNSVEKYQRERGRVLITGGVV